MRNCYVESERVGLHIGRRNMFITLEGLDFSGKSTQATLLVKNLQRQNPTQRVHFIREPGGTRISEQIRNILLNKKHLELSDTAELLLFSASRTQLVSEVIAPALQRGEVVVADRYHDSTTAYQGYGRGLDLETVLRINAFATRNIAPDMTFLVDIPVEEIARRKARAGLTFDRMESSGREFYDRVRNGYLEIARRETGRIVLIDGMKAIDHVEREIWNAVERKMAIISQ
jgi:dTMP kinase